jgi:hypothetical protein
VLRLTLRTLLAYLDDTLEPSEIKKIGQKVAESDTAQELIARIKQVTRRRRLTTPPLTGPNARWDANMVADYLDNELNGDQIAEVEKICLESDVHLAEIAACHQILTLVLGQPALVPPTAKERMYGLVKGREAIPFRKAAAVGAAAADGEDDAEDNPLLGMPFSRGQGGVLRWALPLVGVVLLIGLGVSLFYFLPRPPQNNNNNQQANAKDDTKKDDTGRDQAPKDDAKKDDVKKDDVKKDDVKKDDVKKDDTKKDDVKKDDTKKDDAKKDDTKKDGGASDKPEYKPPAKASMEQAKLGTYRGGVNGAPSVLVQKRKDVWVRQAPSGMVNSAEPLVSLPGYASVVQLDSGVSLILRGHVKELSPQERGYAVMDNLLDSSVTLHKPETGIDLDLTLHHGRIYVANRKETGAALVRLRLRPPDPRYKDDQGEVWDLRLDEPGSEVGVDLLTQYTRDINYLTEEPETQVALCLLDGKAGLRIGYTQLNNLDGATAVLWDNQTGQVQGPVRMPKVPPIWDKSPPLALLRERARDLEELAKKLATKPVAVTLKDLFDDPGTTPYQRVLCLYALSAIDDVKKLLDALGDEDPARAIYRDVVIFTLRRWISRGKEAGGQLYDAKAKTGLLKKQYDSKEAETILVLLHDFSDADRRDKQTYYALVGYLKSTKIAIRALAYWHLTRLAGPTRPSKDFDPAAPPDERDGVADEWKKLIDVGKLPLNLEPPKPKPMDKDKDKDTKPS